MRKKKEPRRIIALVGVVLIVIMILLTLITAIFDPTGVYFRSFLIITIALPIALWVFIWSYGAMMNKKTIASFELGKTGINSDDTVTEDIDESSEEEQ